jgi:hypothetical protein
MRVLKNSNSTSFIPSLGGKGKMGDTPQTLGRKIPAPLSQQFLIFESGFDVVSIS